METSAEVGARSERSRTVRVIGVFVTGVVVEGILYAVAVRGPAMEPLIRPAYPVVALLFMFGMWRASRPRARKDRRHEDRRHRS